MPAASAATVPRTPAPAGSNGPSTPPARDRRHWGGWSMAIVPALIAVGMVAYPLLYNLWISLHISRLSPNDGKFVGLKNYAQLFTFGGLLHTLVITVVWTVAALVGQGVVGFVLALALDRPGRLINLSRTLLLTPWVMPGVVVSAVWLTIYNPIGGLLNGLLGLIGLHGHDWLGDPHTALGALIATNIWKGFPFWMLMLAAGLKAIPGDLFEAASIDGAGYLMRVRHVVLPGLRNVIVLTTLLALLWTFNYFDLAYAMTNGGPGDATTTIAFDIYQTSFVFNRFDQGSALSVLSFILMAIAIAAYARAARRRPA